MSEVVTVLADSTADLTARVRPFIPSVSSF